MRAAGCFFRSSFPLLRAPHGEDDPGELVAKRDTNTLEADAAVAAGDDGGLTGECQVFRRGLRRDQKLGL
jgi:hypothetical protein